MSLVRAVLAKPGLADLPVFECLWELANRLLESDLLALEAPPGSGKTILVPLWMLENAGFERVFVLVPRRVNARLPVLFLADICGPVVGYRIRLESRWDAQRTKVGYLTYGTAVRSFAQQPPGPRDLVIFDEFHERPWEADLLLAWLRGRQQANSGPKVLVMSATLQSEALGAETPIVTSDGRLFPVRVTREGTEPNLIAQPRGLANLVAQRSAELASEIPGEQLIFLPGLAAIRSVETALRADPLGGDIDILHSSLAEAEIRRVVERHPSHGFRRILSTDLAESSVTLAGITTVLDAGLQRRPRHDAFGLGITLETIRAPLASLDQRAGRAGRVGPGRCHRLLTQQDELHRDLFAPPEILSVDGKSLALYLASLQCLADWKDLPWLVGPDGGSLEEAVAWLGSQDLLKTGDKTLNGRGHSVLKASCSPRAAVFGLLATEGGWPIDKVADWVQAMDAGPPRGMSTLTLDELLSNRAWRSGREKKLLDRLRDTFLSVRPRTEVEAGESSLLLRAFADTVVELRGDRALPRLPGAEAPLYRGTSRERYAVLLATAPNGGQGPSTAVSLYQTVSSDSLWESALEQMEETAALQWDPKNRAVKEVRRTTLGALVLEESISAAKPGPDIANVLATQLSPADYGDEYLSLVHRLRLFLEHRPEALQDVLAFLPHGTDPVDGLLQAYLQTLTRWTSGCRQGLLEHIRHSLGFHVLRQLESALPTSVQLPGRRNPVKVHYPSHATPYVASKLQDFFGWTPPPLLDGHLTLVCHLLAPNGRPAQITEDLQGFWTGSYHQVRKDLRGRYPKHAWPENP